MPPGVGEEQRRPGRVHCLRGEDPSAVRHFLLRFFPRLYYQPQSLLKSHQLLRSSCEEGSYLRLVDFCISQL